MPETHRYDYDLILRHVGDFGSYQKKILLMLSCVSAVGGLAVVIFPFTGFVPNFRFINYPPFIFDLFYCVDWNFVIRCRVVNFTQDPSLSPWIGNLSFDFNNRCRNLVGNLITNSALVSWHVPVPGEHETAQWATGDDDVPEICDPEDLVFDDSIMSTTLVQDFLLVCDRAGLRTLVNISYMMGKDNTAVALKRSPELQMTFACVSCKEKKNSQM